MNSLHHSFSTSSLRTSTLSSVVRKPVIRVTCRRPLYTPGQLIEASVRIPRMEGVVMDVPGIKSAILSPVAFGRGEARAAALQMLTCGEKLRCRVRNYNPELASLVLDLAETSDEPLAVAVPSPVKPVKPAYTVLKSGTRLLWDTANLLGAVGPEQAAHLLETLAESLVKAGYENHFFLERRGLRWALGRQETEMERAALKKFVASSHVTLVGDDDEADDVLLQVAEVEPDTVCVSRDAYADYAQVHPTIVGTDRVRSFSVSKLGDKTYISVRGLAKAILVEAMPATRPIACTAAVPETRPVVSAPSVPEPKSTPRVVEAPTKGPDYKVLADNYLAHGQGQKAVAYYLKAAAQDPSVYDTLADLYAAGCADVPADAKAVAKYERLGRDGLKRQREREMRERRRCCQAFRLRNLWQMGMSSSKRREAVQFVARSLRRPCLAA